MPREVVMMSEERAIVVAVEDAMTATTGAAEAAHVAVDTAATTGVLLHVLDAHTMVNAMFTMGGYWAPIAETREDGAAVLDVAEGALRAELAALGRPAPAIRHEIAEGSAGEAIAHDADAHDAIRIVLGARRPHAFGRLTHPDVRAHLAAHGRSSLHLAALQAPSDAGDAAPDAPRDVRP